MTGYICQKFYSCYNVAGGTLKRMIFKKTDIYEWYYDMLSEFDILKWSNYVFKCQTPLTELPGFNRMCDLTTIVDINDILVGCLCILMAY